MVEYEKLVNTDEDETNVNDSSDPVYIAYKRRWFYLFVVCLAQISNAWLWINFSPIANISADYFKVSYDAINWLSLIYMITTIPLTLPSTWLIDRLGIRAGMLIGTGLNFFGSVVRCLSAISGLSISTRFPLVMTGQFLCSFAQTFILFIPTKFSFVWFTEQQRSLANSIAIGSNFFGILISSILTPIIVRTPDQIPTMLYISVIPALLALVLSLAIRSAEPPTPSCRAVVHISQPFLHAIRRLLFSKSYMILFFGCGIAIGCFNTLSTLVEQIMCPFGYDNVTVGLCLGWFIGAGSFGSLVFGYFADRTGRLEEISKILYIASSIAYIVLVLFIKNSLTRYLIYFAFGFVGFVSLPISPLSMDLSLECVYPIPEATATGINVLASQIIGMIMVIVFPKMGRPLSVEEMRIASCSNDVKSRIAVLDYTVPLYLMTLFMVAVTMLYFFLFKCPYGRRRRH